MSPTSGRQQPGIHRGSATTSRESDSLQMEAPLTKHNQSVTKCRTSASINRRVVCLCGCLCTAACVCACGRRCRLATRQASLERASVASRNYLMAAECRGRESRPARRPLHYHKTLCVTHRSTNSGTYTP